jgi:uncharacterized membrane protein YphA (DoxX/SURF4 family)
VGWIFAGMSCSQIPRVKVTARIALGLIWLYEGVVPKLLFLHADQIELVRRSGICWYSAQGTLQVLGAAQAMVGCWLLSGLMERASAVLATVWMCALIILVAKNNPGLLVDPYGALVKDFSLIACGYAVWVLSDKTPATAAR